MVEVHGMLATVLVHGTGERIRCRPPRDRTTPVVGDRADIDEAGGEPTIVALAARERTLTRPISEHKPLVIATHVDRLLVVSAVDPPPRPGLVDRILCAVGDEPIEVVLIVNKIDMPGVDAAIKRLDAHAGLDYAVVPVSAVRGDGIAALRERIATGLTVVMGHSGVGKSTLLNALVPGAELVTAEVNEKTGKGRHTTTVSTCHVVDGPWPRGGLVVDTPGIRAFPLHGLALTEIAGRFPGFRAATARCRFVDCLHETEPDCGVAEAVAAGTVPRMRQKAWLALLERVRAERSTPTRRPPSPRRPG
ncbi:MAG: ribosome small subunit-dependent GTPase A [Deltaproteobacteria bacterium HGW-Deltaproteobacteria-14]|nr:MAG: ribosome small subunit-dependent GTPase A [Deltaproteobacteria bacterium HGW-Deltaproteobacteria-14]